MPLILDSSASNLQDAFIVSSYKLDGLLLWLLRRPRARRLHHERYREQQLMVVRVFFSLFTVQMDRKSIC